MMRRKNKCQKSRGDKKRKEKGEEKPALRENNYEENPEQNDNKNGKKEALSVRRISCTIRSPVTHVRSAQGRNETILIDTPDEQVVEQPNASRALARTPDGAQQLGLVLQMAKEHI